MQKRGQTQRRNEWLQRAAGAVVPFGLLLVALLCAAPTALAAPVTKEEPLFRIGGVAPTSIAADQTTGHLFFFDSNGTTAFNGHRIDEYTPWGEFVRTLGADVAPGPVDEVQEVRARASSGTFELGFEGAETGDLPFDASGAEIEAALESLAPIGGAGGEVSVAERPGAADGTTPFIYVITFEGSLGATDLPALEVNSSLAGGDPQTQLEVRIRADGTAGGTGLESCADKASCQGGRGGAQGGQFGNSASIAVSPNTGDIYVGESGRIQQLTPAGRFIRAFGGDTLRDGAVGTGVVTPGSDEVTAVLNTEKSFRAGQPIEGAGIEPGTTIVSIGNGNERNMILSQPAGPTATGASTSLSTPAAAGNVPVNERFRLTVEGSQPFRLGTAVEIPYLSSSGSNQTADLPTTASAAEVEAALVATPQIEPGEVAVTGADGGPWTVEVKGARYGGAETLEISKSPNSMGPVSVAAEAAEETCQMAAECEVGHGAGYRLAFSPDGSTLYAGYGARVRRFSPEGADLGDLPDPGRVLDSARFRAEGIRYLAVSPVSGDLYLDTDSSSGLTDEGSVYEMSASSGALVRKLATSSPRSNGAGPLAVASDGTLYTIALKPPGFISVHRYSHVVAFDAQGSRLAPSLAEEEQCEKEEGEDPRGYCEKVLGITLVSEGSQEPARGLGMGPTGDLYVSGALQEGEKFIRGYGPAPLSLESPAPVPPTIEDELAVSVDTTGAQLRALINPHFYSGKIGTTHYYVQYGPAGCVEAEGWEAACVKDSASPPGSTLRGSAANEGLPATAFLLGLTPGTEYSYRYVAESSGAPGAEVKGAAAGFTTARSEGQTAECSANEAFRTGPSAALPDCRAYEMVSPVDKGGGDIVQFPSLRGLPLVDQSSTGGDRFAFASYRSFGDAPSAQHDTQYVASRSGASWRTHSISAPGERPLTSLLAMSVETYAFSPDLCQAWVKPFVADPPLAPGATEGQLNVYRRTDEECGGPAYEALEPVARVELPAAESFGVELQGVSADGSKSFLAARGGPLAPGAPALGEKESQLYENVGGQLHFVCLLPNGEPMAEPCAAGSPNTHDGAGGFPEGFSNHVHNAVSTDGDRVFWTAASSTPKPLYLRRYPDRSQSALEGGTATGTGRVTKGSTSVTSLVAGEGSFAGGQRITGPNIPYGTTIVEVKPGELVLSQAPTKTKIGASLAAYGPCAEAAAACSVDVSEAAEIASGTEGSRYWTASPQGSRAIFTTGDDLYEAEVKEDAGQLSVETQPIAGEVVAELGASEDARRIYFASEEVLTSTPNAEAKSPTPGGLNLYLWDADKSAAGRFAFLGTLAGQADLGGQQKNSFSPLNESPNRAAARVSPDGAHAAFVSWAELTGYDNRDLENGEPAAEVYLYDAEANGGAGKLVCASCNPSGARPTAGEPGEENSVWMAAMIPGAWNQLSSSRPLSENGRRLFFNSFDALTPRDTNGAEDVYEWEAAGEGGCSEQDAAYRAGNGGCVYLISSGTNPEGSEFLDADPGGKNVFFTTLDGLVPQDPGLIDVYDAREGGGLPPPPARAASCEGEACQSAPEAPNDPTPASSSLEGAGNVKQEARAPRRCAKAKVRRRGRCVPRHRKAKHRRHAKHAKRQGRTAR